MRLTAHEDAELTDEQVRELAGRLDEAHRDLVGRIDVLSAELAEGERCQILDVADAARERESKDRTTQLRVRAKAQLTEVEAARQRLLQGTYGLCEASEEPIGFKRLRVIPWARRAVGE